MNVEHREMIDLFISSLEEHFEKDLSKDESGDFVRGYRTGCLCASLFISKILEKGKNNDE